VEYWENFATHAFENTAQSVYSHCVLLKPNGTPVPATFCFHIRRDLFDLPSLVIGACFHLPFQFCLFPIIIDTDDPLSLHNRPVASTALDQCSTLVSSLVVLGCRCHLPFVIFIIPYTCHDLNPFHSQRLVCPPLPRLFLVFRGRLAICIMASTVLLK
jgi:hypothetical protein